MLFNCPISAEKADLLISMLRLVSTYKVIDLGCGEGKFLTRIQQESGADCLGMDINPSCILIAEQKVQRYSLGKKLRFQLGDVQTAQLENDSFELAVCMGSTHIFGQGEAAYSNSLRRMSEIVKPDGLILVGEGFWSRKPEQEYLDFLGDPVGVYNDHDQNVQQAESLGLTPLYATTSSQDEWDHFEWSFLMNAEYQAVAEPDNHMVKKKLERTRQWNKYYRKFGRTTMGFGFYLFMKR